jgi:hypothetical protein
MTEDFVPKFYRMNPETDDLVMGSDLKDGMVVLIESSNFRLRHDEPMVDWEMDRALENNRWCTVTNLKFSNAFDAPIATFIGVYEDGTKYKRSYGTGYAWYVKKNIVSIEETEKYRKVSEVLMGTVELSIAALSDVDLSDELKQISLKAIVKTATKTIMDL